MLRIRQGAVQLEVKPLPADEVRLYLMRDTFSESLSHSFFFFFKMKVVG